MGTTSHLQVKKARAQMFRGLADFQRQVGVTILWFEYNNAASSTDQTYSEGPVPGISFQDTYGEATGAQTYNGDSVIGGNMFKGPIPVPAVWVRYMEPWDVQSESGMYLTSHISLRVSADQMRKIGLGHPENPADHMNDRFSYKSKLFRVQDYVPRGELIAQYLMVDVVGTELKEADLQTDPFPFWVPPTTPWGPQEQMNWPIPNMNWQS